MTQDPDNYRIPATRNNGDQRHPYTNQPRTEVGPDDVWVPNPGTSSTYPSRPAPLGRDRDPNEYNPYAPAAPIPNRAFEVSDAEQRRIEARGRNNLTASEDRRADAAVAARARGQNYRPAPANNMATEAENYVTLLGQGYSAAVADAATDNVRYPTRSGSERGPTNDALDARALEVGREAYQRTRPGRVNVEGRQVDAQLYAVAVAVRGELLSGNPYPYERYPESLRADTATLTQAVSDMQRRR